MSWTHSRCIADVSQSRPGRFVVLLFLLLCAPHVHAQLWSSHEDATRSQNNMTECGKGWCVVRRQHLWDSWPRSVSVGLGDVSAVGRSDCT
jgi:hypothetical protein